MAKVMENEELAARARACGRDGLAEQYESVARVDGIRAVKAIIAAGGVAVWAHPLGGVREKRLDAEKFSKQLLVLIDAGIRGLECYYSEYTMDEVEKLCSAAKEHGLLISGGSDYHGTGKPHLHLGMLNKEDKIIEEEKLTVLDVLN